MLPQDRERLARVPPVDSARVRLSDRQEHSVPVLLRGRVHRPDARVLVALATRLNWSASRSVATAAAIAVMQAVPEPVHAAELGPTALPCPPACASQSLPGSSCSCRNPRVDRLYHRRAVPMARLSRRVVMAPRPHLRSIDPLPPRQQPRAVLASVLEQGLVVSVDPGVLTGMTAQSWKLCAIGLPRSNAKRFTSLAKTMIR